MNEDFAICIPTYKRAERLLYNEGQITLAYMHHSLMDYIYLFVRDFEEEAYVLVAERFGVGLVTIPNDTDGIKGTRDEIVNWARYNKLEKVIMMDDDLRLDVKPNSRKYIRMIDGFGFNKMVGDLLRYCTPECPLTGITARQFSMDKTREYDENTRIIQVLCFYMDILNKENISFCSYGIDMMTDYAVVLDLLSKGYHNKCLNTYCRDDNSQTPGGCAEYRTTEMQSISAVRLSKLFPGVVTPYVKTTGTWKDKRVNARINWKKAFKSKE